MNLNAEYDNSTALTKLAAISDKNGNYTLFSFGGSQSGGASYTVELNVEQPKWKLLGSSYLSLFQGSEDDIELLFKQCVHFQ